MVLYVESSAVLSWLFGEGRSGEVAAAFESASLIVTSELTKLECAQAIHRARAGGLVNEAQARALHADYDDAVRQWDLLPMGDRVVHVGSAPWPVEPLRALDAIHLASVLIARDARPGLRLLTLDRQIEANAKALGVELGVAHDGTG